MVAIEVYVVKKEVLIIICKEKVDLVVEVIFVVLEIDCIDNLVDCNL